MSGSNQADVSEHAALPWRTGYAHAVAGAAATSLLATLLLPYLDLPNIVVLFLLAVMVTALHCGRGPAIAASILNVAAFDFFCVPPRFSFAVADLQDLVIFGVMLAVGIVTGHLASDLRQQALLSAERERRTRALYEFARQLSGAIGVIQITEWTLQAIQDSFGATALLLVAKPDGQLSPPSFSTADNPHGLHLSVLDMATAQWAFDHAAPSGRGTGTMPASGYAYLPLVAPMRVRGVLAIRLGVGNTLPAPEQGEQLDAFAALVAIALERVHYIEVANDAQLRVASEQLRNSLLSALSHDLRTPLTSLVGLSESLAMSIQGSNPVQAEMATALRDEALRMCGSVDNLLDMARIQSGAVRLNCQWHSIEEVVGSALRTARPLLSRHLVRTDIAPDLPLVRFDATLIERVLANLIGNAAKYTLPGSTVSLSARVQDDMLAVLVEDDGPGLPPGREDALFEKFMRGAWESQQPGVGLGLSICRALIEAHDGAIHAGTAATGGAGFTILLPLGTPPAMPEPEDAGLRETGVA